MNEAHRQLTEAGLINYIGWLEADEDSVEGWAVAALIPDLRKDERFQEGLLFGLHTNVGKHLTDFRALRGSFGKGSLQIVVDKKTGRCYCDVDGFSPYGDVVGFIGHSAEVVKNWWRRHV